MPKTIQKISSEIASVWRPRIDVANRYYDDWANRFDVDALEQAYYGFQWDNIDDRITDYRSYVLNMIFSSIDVKMPNLLFEKPIYTVKPNPSKQDFEPIGAHQRSKLKEDTINHLVQRGIPHFTEELELAMLDAWFRYGVLEIGYSSDWINNPDAGKPFLESDRRLMVDKDGKVVEQPELLPENERIYVKRIPAKFFRVGGMDHKIPERCSWLGYFEVQKREDLIVAAKRNRNYNLEAIENIGGSRSPDSISFQVKQHLSATEKSNFFEDQDNVPIWKIWDNRSKNFYIFDVGVGHLLYTENFDRLPLKILKFRDMLEGFYPLPMVFNWASPQAEINETREAARIHRRRFQRKYLVEEGVFTDEEERDKLFNGGDGTFANVAAGRSQGVLPLPNANLGVQHDQSLVTANDDFNRISATSAEQRGQSDRSTATQSQIIENRANIRESRDKNIIAKYLVGIGKEILLVAKERLTLPFWIKLNSDGPGIFAEAQATEEKYELILTDDFGDEDFEVDIQVSSLSPVDQQVEKNKLVEFLTVISSFPQVTISPVLTQAVADSIGIRQEKVVAEMVRMSTLLQTIQLIQLSQQTGQDLESMGLDLFSRVLSNGNGGGNGQAQGRQAQLTPPNIEEIRNQVTNQLTV